MHDLRKAILNELERRDMTQAELSRLTGILPHRISEYLSGNRDMYGESLDVILDALDLEIRPATRRRKGK